MVRSAVVTNNKTREEAEVPVDWVVVCVGTEPNTALARAAGLEMAGDLVKIDRRMMTSKPPVFACGEITGCDKHIVPVASEGATAGMAASQYLALEKVKRGETFDTAVCGKYADEYKAMLC